MASLFASSIFDSPFDHALRASATVVPSSWRDMEVAPDPEAQRSLLAQLGLAGLSGASYVGSKLDQGTGSRAVRGLLGGELQELLSIFPLSDEFGITDPADKVSGKDLAAQYLGLRDNPHAWSDDIAGFGIEALLDPTLPLTFGTGAALTGAGRLAKAAGVLGDATAAAAAREAAKVVANQAAKAPGTMASRVGMTLREFLDYAPNNVATRDRLLETAQRMGTTVDDALLDQKLSGLVGAGIPFRDPSMVFGTGQTGEKIAGLFDTIGAGAYHAPYSPLPVLRGLFDPAVKNLTNPAEQEIAAASTRALEPEMFESRRQMADLQQALDRTEFLRQPSRELNNINRARFYRYLEGLDDGTSLPAYLQHRLQTQGDDLDSDVLGYFDNPENHALPTEVRAVADSLKNMGGEIRKILDDAGLKSPELQDEFVKYAARLKRSFPDDPISGSRSGRVVDTTNPANTRREDFLRNLPGGTALIDELAMDDQIAGLLHRANYRNNRLPLSITDESLSGNPDTRAMESLLSSREKAKEHLIANYGPQIDPVSGEVIDGTDRLGPLLSDEKRRDDFRQLVDWLIQLPKRHSEQSVPFYADPTEAYLSRLTGARQAASQARLATDLLAGKAYRSDELVFAEPSQTLGKSILGIGNLDYLRSGQNIEQALQKRFSQALGPEGESLRRSFAKAQQDALEGLDYSEIVSNATRVAREQGLLAPGQGIEPANVTDEIAAILENEREKLRLSGLLNRYVTPSSTVETATKSMQRFMQPEAPGALERFLRGATNAFKFGSTSPFAAFQVRNLGSGDFNNIVSGAYANPLDWAGTHREAHQILSGQTPAGIAQRYAHLFGEGLSDEQTVDQLRSLVFAGDLANPASNVSFDGAPSLRVAGETNPITLTGGFKPNDAFSWLQAINPLATRGVATQGDAFYPARAANQVGAWVEGQNRVSPFLAFLRQGIDPQEAARRVLESQVDYSSATDFERKYLKLLFPFYSFTRGMVPFTANQLSSHPAGAMAQAVRGQARLQDENQFVPESVSQTTAIPLPFGQDSDSLRYLTGFGLSFEDPLSLVRPGADPFRAVQNTVGELMGRVNPLLKAPIELAAGKQFFSGRDLEDLDSGVGRIVSNLGITEEPPEVPILADQLLANSPVARLLSTIRTATDPRKRDFSLPLNLATGVRITDVPEEKSAQVAQRNAIELLLRGQPGVYSTRANLFVSPEDFLTMSPQEQSAYLLYRQLQSSMRN